MDLWRYEFHHRLHQRYVLRAGTHNERQCLLFSINLMNVWCDCAGDVGWRSGCWNKRGLFHIEIFKSIFQTDDYQLGKKPEGMGDLRCFLNGFTVSLGIHSMNNSSNGTWPLTWYHSRVCQRQSIAHRLNSSSEFSFKTHIAHEPTGIIESWENRRTETHNQSNWKISSLINLFINQPTVISDN